MLRDEVQRLNATRATEKRQPKSHCNEKTNNFPASKHEPTILEDFNCAILPHTSREPAQLEKL